MDFAFRQRSVLKHKPRKTKRYQKKEKKAEFFNCLTKGFIEVRGIGVRLWGAWITG